MTARVSSHMRRRAQSEPDAYAYLLDESGKRFDESERGQTALVQTGIAGSPLGALIEPNGSITSRFAFDVTIGARGLGFVKERRSRFPAIIVIGDPVSLFHRRTVVPLERLGFSTGVSCIRRARAAATRGCSSGSCLPVFDKAPILRYGIGRVAFGVDIFANASILPQTRRGRSTRPTPSVIPSAYTAVPVTSIAATGQANCRATFASEALRQASSGAVPVAGATPDQSAASTC